MSGGESILFEDTFEVENVNSVKYDRVSRISANSEDRNTMMMLDVNTELYPIAEGDRVKVVLALTLNLDGSKDDTKGWREVGMGEQTLANEYDYVCHGKIYRFEEAKGDNMLASAMRLHFRALADMRTDTSTSPLAAFSCSSTDPTIRSTL